MRRLAYIASAFIALVVWSCNQEKQTEAPPTSSVEEAEVQQEESVMYEMSELAVLMEAMTDSLETWKESIEKGGLISRFPESFRAIHSATATDGFDVTDEFYKTTGQSYLSAVDSLITATPENVTDRYNLVVANCLACHQVKCPGPIQKIKKLKIKE